MNEFLRHVKKYCLDKPTSSNYQIFFMQVNTARSQLNNGKACRNAKVNEIKMDIQECGVIQTQIVQTKTKAFSKKLLTQMITQGQKRIFWCYDTRFQFLNVRFLKKKHTKKLTTFDLKKFLVFLCTFLVRRSTLLVQKCINAEILFFSVFAKLHLTP